MENENWECIKKGSRAEDNNNKKLGMQMNWRATEGLGKADWQSTKLDLAFY